MIDAIVSGAQTGADLGGLLAAEKLQLGMGGYMPKDYKTEAGLKPEYADRFGVVESDSSDYLVRTSLNVNLADATAVFGRRSPGSNRTEEFARLANKPCCWVIWPNHGYEDLTAFVCPSRTLMLSPSNYRGFKLWLGRNKVKILNVAGNRESNNKGIAEFTKSFLIKALK